ncbi:MAG: YabP/YqfC family sporulation protein [Clostridia bacterium]|nr:YabP/YqfC family sporulation protein [Clostridia bacterium]
MINLVSELLDKISLSSESVGFRYLNLGGKVLYLIGFKSVLKFSSNEITFKINNSTIITVRGDNLYIKEMDASSAMVCGEIKAVEAI